MHETTTHIEMYLVHFLLRVLCFVLNLFCKNAHASLYSSFISGPSNFPMKLGYRSLGILTSPFLCKDVYLYGFCKNEEINPITSRHLIVDLSIISPH